MTEKSGEKIEGESGLGKKEESKTHIAKPHERYAELLQELSDLDTVGISNQRKNYEEEEINKQIERLRNEVWDQKDPEIEAQTSLGGIYRILDLKAERGEPIIGSTSEVFDAKTTKGKVNSIIDNYRFMPPEQIQQYLDISGPAMSFITSRSGLRDKVRSLLLEVFTVEAQEKSIGKLKSKVPEDQPTVEKPKLEQGGEPGKREPEKKWWQFWKRQKK